MHSIALVLLPPTERDIQAGIERQLLPHLWDEDNPDKDHHLDRWNYGTGDIGTPAITAELGLTEHEWATNVCRVRQLPAEYTPAVVVDPNGAWLSISDHGWSEWDLELPENKAALVSWQLALRAIFGRYPDWLAVEVDVHS